VVRAGKCPALLSGVSKYVTKSDSEQTECLPSKLIDGGGIVRNSTSNSGRRTAPFPRHFRPARSVFENRKILDQFRLILRAKQRRETAVTHIPVPQPTDCEDTRAMTPRLRQGGRQTAAPVARAVTLSVIALSEFNYGTHPRVPGRGFTLFVTRCTLHRIAPLHRKRLWSFQ